MPRYHGDIGAGGTVNAGSLIVSGVDVGSSLTDLGSRLTAMETASEVDVSSSLTDLGSRLTAMETASEGYLTQTAGDARYVPLPLSIPAEYLTQNEGDGRYVELTDTGASAIQYLSGVSSSIQTQLDYKQPAGTYQTALDAPAIAAANGSGNLTLTSNTGFNSQLTYTPPDLSPYAPLSTPIFSGEVRIVNGGSGISPTQFNYNNTGANYIKGPTIIVNGGSGIDPTYFNYQNTGANYIRGPTTISHPVTMEATSWMNCSAGWYFRQGGFEIFHDAYTNGYLNRWNLSVNPAGRINLFQPNYGNGAYINHLSTTGWQYFSDERIKTDIEPLTDCLAKVMQVRAVSFRLKKQESEDRSVGFIAQDWHAVQPEVVSFTETEDLDDVMGLSYTATIPVLLGAIKELNVALMSQGERFSAQIAALEARLSDAGIA